jgi:hypothetical protein
MSGLQAATQMFVRPYWPCDITWKWAREGYKPGTYDAPLVKADSDVVAPAP